AGAANSIPPAKRGARRTRVSRAKRGRWPRHTAERDFGHGPGGGEPSSSCTMSDNDVLVAGVDSSTQSTKVMVCDARTGVVVRSGRAEHPDTTEVEPSEWWSALTSATGGILDGVAAIGVAGQQHGMVTVDDRGEMVRPALLWNDTRSA